MASNHGVVYLGPGRVEVQSIDYPELKTPREKKVDHGVIIKPITTNICGSDQHMVRGRTTAWRRQSAARSTFPNQLNRTIG